jgi:hypothetical protein
MRAKVVITGTGRCGTQYIVEVLRAAGIPAAHERLFGRMTALSDFHSAGRHNQDGPPVTVEASWLALPYLQELRDDGWMILHQRRSPWDVVRSLIGIGFFHPEAQSAHEPYSGFMRRHFRDQWRRRGPVDRAVAFYLQAIEMAQEHCELSYPVEDVDLMLPGLAGAGILIDPQVWTRAKAAVGTKKVNSRPRPLLDEHMLKEMDGALRMRLDREANETWAIWRCTCDPPRGSGSHAEGCPGPYRPA